MFCFLPFTFNFLLMLYQLDFRTPGIKPSLASSRKQIRQTPKSPMYPRPRPQRKQRFFARELNFGFFCDRATVDVFAILCIFTGNISSFFVCFRVKPDKGRWIDRYMS